jgi:hypothetical protein
MRIKLAALLAKDTQTIPSAQPLSPTTDSVGPMLLTTTQMDEVTEGAIPETSWPLPGDIVMICNSDSLWSDETCEIWEGLV